MSLQHLELNLENKIKDLISLEKPKIIDVQKSKDGDNKISFRA